VTELLRTLRGCELKSREDGSVMEEGSFAVGLLSRRDQGRIAVFSTSSFVGDTEFAIGDNESLLDDILNEALPGEPQMILAAKKAGEEIPTVFNNAGLVVSRENVWDYYPEKVEG